MSASARSNAPARRVGASRDVLRTAPARCRCYRALSELLASPHEVEIHGTVEEHLAAARDLPFGFALDPLIREFAAADPGEIRIAYSSLFEVGSQGPPAPIREDLNTGQKSGTREDIVRFYEFFGYRLEERFAWAPDHLSVELEFMHFLIWHEASGTGDALSYQLGQIDFAERHLQNWVPGFAAKVAGISPDAFHGRVLLALRDFLAHDLAWQRSTIETQ